MVIPCTEVLVFPLSMVFTNALEALNKKETMSLTPCPLALEFYLRQRMIHLSAVPLYGGPGAPYIGEPGLQF